MTVKLVKAFKDRKNKQKYYILLTKWFLIWSYRTYVEQDSPCGGMKRIFSKKQAKKYIKKHCK